MRKKYPDEALEAVKILIKTAGEDPNSERFKKTPKRFLNLFDTILCGKNLDPVSTLKYSTQSIEKKHICPILIENINVFSICEHHLTIMEGKVSVSYLPDKKIAGFGKIQEIVRICAGKLQLQERITLEILETLKEGLAPIAAKVEMEAKHLCGICLSDKQPIKAKTVSFFGEEKMLRLFSKEID